MATGNSRYEKMNISHKSKQTKPRSNSTNDTAMVIQRASLNAPETGHVASSGAEYEDDLSIYKMTAASSESFESDDVYIKSYFRYTIWNGLRFIAITGLMLGMAISRQLELYDHYSPNLCCFCYQEAYISQRGESKAKQKIFEWASCQYDILDVNQKHIDSKCWPNFNWNAYPLTYNTSSIHDEFLKIHNLSTHYDLFGTKFYYIITASIVFFIALLYATISIWRALKIKNTTQMRREALYQLLHNVIVSLIIFYQILINYQYHKPSDVKYNPVMGLPTPPTTSGVCYVNALNNTTEIIIRVVLISACVYILSPCFIQICLHFADNCFAKCIKAWYNWIIYIFGSLVTLSVFTIIIYYTYRVLDNFHWHVRIMVIIVDILLMASFFDILLFKIRHYAKAPFVSILRVICCCYYKYCKGDSNIDQISYRDRYPSVSVSSNYNNSVNR